MKNALIVVQFMLVSLILFSVTSQAQNAKEILQKSYTACRNIQNGHYEMTKQMKFLTSKDTVTESFKCYFRKLAKVSPYPTAYHNFRYRNGKYIGEALFTGQDMVSAFLEDTTAVIASKGNYLSENIQNYDNGAYIYQPLITKTIYPFIDDSGHFEKGCTVSLLGEEQSSTVSCYSIKVKRSTEGPEKQEGIKQVKDEYYYWIDKKNMIPVVYTDYCVLEMNNTTMDQYEKYTLDKYEINGKVNDSIFSLNSIPSFYKLKTFTPYKASQLLPTGSAAPQWSLSSLKGETINLSDFIGRVVLVDFFYESCYPCMLALPKLMALYEKYKSKGLVVVGIDPIDKNENDLKSFLEKKGVTYTVLLGGKDLIRDYHLSGYPTIYILDKSGKILFDLAGYSRGVEDVFEEVVKKAL